MASLSDRRIELALKAIRAHKAQPFHFGTVLYLSHTVCCQHPGSRPHLEPCASLAACVTKLCR